MAELADAPDLGLVGDRAGSSPVTRMISGFLKHLRCFRDPVFLHLTAI